MTEEAVVEGGIAAQSHVHSYVLEPLGKVEIDVVGEIVITDADNGGAARQGSQRAGDCAGSSNGTKGSGPRY
ncbi:hypothetical protein SAMN04487912_105185 [Arthrobacter sp. cf158]|nr:hypothetical protein [Arthrobacter sp. cf158]SDW87557.1 hypothetical protein SAMN04487912_105185 [Arthrobacter sp. cf158]